MLDDEERVIGETFNTPTIDTRVKINGKIDEYEEEEPPVRRTYSSNNSGNKRIIIILFLFSFVTLIGGLFYGYNMGKDAGYKEGETAAKANFECNCPTVNCPTTQCEKTDDKDDDTDYEQQIIDAINDIING